MTYIQQPRLTPQLLITILYLLRQDILLFCRCFQEFRIRLVLRFQFCEVGLGGFEARLEGVV